MADDGGGGKPQRDWRKWPKLHFSADLDEVKKSVLDTPSKKRERAPLRRPKFQFHAKLENIKGKVLDGKELPREPIGPELPERFVLINQIGSGAQSSVFAVFDRELNCKAALKFFKGGGEARGIKEGQTLSGVEHPNIVRVHDVQQNAEGRLFLRMEFIDGPTLSKWVEKRSWREVLGAYVQAGRGLAAAHKAGIVHRDFKPENALVRDEDNRVVVVDFGLARGRLDAPDIPGVDTKSSASMSFPLHDTRSGLLGTMGYMAPEQWGGKQESVDARSDQFNFCVALYEAFDGQRPFRGSTAAQVMDAVTLGKIKGPPKNAPPWVWRVIRRGLAVDPAQRYPSMNALLAALENDPRKWFVRTGLFAGLLALAGVGWQVVEGFRADTAQARAAEEEAKRLQEAAEQRLIDRSDVVTLREAINAMSEDPTEAMALLGLLSPDSKLWDDPPVRMLAADADYRVVARRVRQLGPQEDPYALSPDGTIAISRNHNTREVSLHRLDTKAVRRMGVADAGLSVVEFSPDGRFIATQGVPKGVHRWDTTSDVEPELIGESPAEHHRMVFVSESTIVTFGRDPDVIVWQGGGKQVLGDHVPPVDEITVDQGGRWAATFDGARKLRLWSLDDGKARIVAEAIEPMAFSSRAALAVTAMSACSELVEHQVSEVRIIDPTTGSSASLCTDIALPIAELAFSPSGKRIAAALPGQVLVWDLDTGARTDLERPDEEANELRFASDDVLGSRSPDTTLVLWVLPSERPYVLQGHVGIAHWGRRSDGTIVTYGQEGGIREWTLPLRKDRSLRSHDDTVMHVAYAGDKQLVTASNDGSVRVWPLDGGEDRVLSEGEAEIGAMAVDFDGKRVAFVRGLGEVVVVPLHGSGEAALVKRAQVFGLAWNGEGNCIAIADKDGGLDIVDASSGGVLVSIREDDGFKARGVRFRGDGGVTAAGWLDDNSISVRVFDATTGKRRSAHDRGPTASEISGATAVAFDDEGRRVAITTFHRSVVVWDAEAEQDGMRILGKHDRLVPGAAFAPGGNLLVTVDEGGVAKLWDVASGFSRTIQLRRPLQAVAFHPDGKTFAAVGDARVAFFGRDDLPRDSVELRDWVASATDLKVETAELPWVVR